MNGRVSVRVGDRWGARSAFTMIELMVSISVIAVLMGIALPALRMARESGRRAVCLANLHTFGQAFQMYRDDHGGALPYAHGSVYNIIYSWTDPLDDLMPYLDGVSAPSVGPDGVVITGPPFRCPSDPGVADESGMSYGYGPGEFMGTRPAAESTKERSHIAKQITEEEYKASPFGARLWVLADADGWHAQSGGDRHSRRNVLHFDGSVGPGAERDLRVQ